MPMGIVSDSDFEKEIGRLTPTVKREPVRIPEIIEEKKEDNRGRGEGNVEVPDSLRQLIGNESIENGREAALELAKQFGISPSSASAYAVGATSTASYDKRPNADKIEKSKMRVSIKARRKLMMALDAITDDKLEGTKARDLAGIAKDMSAVMRNMESDKPQGPTEGAGKPAFIFYTPVFKQENHYDTITAKE